MSVDLQKKAISHDSPLSTALELYRASDRRQVLSDEILVAGLEARKGRRDLGQAALGLWSAKSCSREQTECRGPDGAGREARILDIYMQLTSLGK